MNKSERAFKIVFKLFSIKDGDEKKVAQNVAAKGKQNCFN